VLSLKRKARTRRAVAQLQAPRHRFSPLRGVQPLRHRRGALRTEASVIRFAAPTARGGDGPRARPVGMAARRHVGPVTRLASRRQRGSRQAPPRGCCPLTAAGRDAAHPHRERVRGAVPSGHSRTVRERSARQGRDAGDSVPTPAARAWPRSERSRKTPRLQLTVPRRTDCPCGSAAAARHERIATAHQPRGASDNRTFI